MAVFIFKDLEFHFPIEKLMLPFFFPSFCEIFTIKSEGQMRCVIVFHIIAVVEFQGIHEKRLERRKEGLLEQCLLLTSRNDLNNMRIYSKKIK